jgi:nitrate reductase cytochrome c-type subunit
MTVKGINSMVLLVVATLGLCTILACDILPPNVAFPGAPPTILHQSYGCSVNCLNCHETGADGAPVTPHPERQLCNQCHLPQQDVPLFVENTFRP